MAYKICLQAGHENCQNNSIVALRGSTGAPGEMAFNVDMVSRIKKLFEKIPEIEITTVDSCANDKKEITEKDWTLFLAVHYDADIYNDTGGFVDFPEPSTDGATKESQRIAGIFADTYFAETGIKQVSKRSNANTRYYYMWKYLTAKTPCVLLECGVGWRKPNDFEMLNTEDGRIKVANAIAKSICKAFNVKFPEDTQEHEDTQAYEDMKQKAGYYENIRAKIGVTEDKYSKTIERIDELLSKEVDHANREEQVTRLKTEMETLTNALKAAEKGCDVKISEIIKPYQDETKELGKKIGKLQEALLQAQQSCQTAPNPTPEETLPVGFWQSLSMFLSNLFNKGGQQ